MNEITSLGRSELNNNNSGGGVHLKTAKFQVYTSSASSSDTSEEPDSPSVQDEQPEDTKRGREASVEECDPRRFRSMSDGSPLSPNPEWDVPFEIFPSLPNDVLKKMDLFGEGPRKHLTDDEIEQKFESLSLAFSIDEKTIKDRCDRQRRCRDQTEVNLNKEIERMVEKVNRLQPLCVDMETTELLTNLLAQVDIIIRATAHVAISAERFGAVQHEERLAESVQLMINHVKVLKQQRDATRRQLQCTKTFLQNPIEPSNVKQRNSYLSNRGGMNKRRASIATVTQHQEVGKLQPGDNKRITRRTSELLLKSNTIGGHLQRLPASLELNLIKLRKVAAPIVNEENDEELEETHLCSEEKAEDLSTTRTEEKSSSQVPELDFTNMLLKDKLIYRARKALRHMECSAREWMATSSSSEVFNFCALLCLSLGVVALGNVLVELEYAKRGIDSTFHLWNLINPWKRNENSQNA